MASAASRVHEGAARRLRAERRRYGCPAGGELMLQAENIRFRYGAGPWVLHGVTLDVASGECVGIVGASGSGKSTLARCLCGLLRPQSGTVSIHGKPLLSGRRAELKQLRQQVQMVFQDPDLSLPHHLPVGVVLQDAARFRGGAKSEQRQRLLSLLERLDLPADTLRRRPRELSGGQRQRVAIARALVVSPSVVILDEPTSALDVTTQRQMMTLLRELRQEAGTAEVVITHDIGFALRHCDRMVVMHEGRIVEAGPVEHFRGKAEHPYTERLLAAVPAATPAGRRWILTWQREFNEFERSS